MKLINFVRPATRRGRVLRVILVVVLGLTAFVYVNNSSWLAGARQGRPLLLAHRGLAQTFGFEGLDNDTCTAARIHPPDHPYLENTLPSMRAAFDLGADVVELDIQQTRDNQFAVFHDATLECRTDGTGRIRDHTMAELRRLDVGYGYTADGGRSFPFRGKGIGLMPSLDEVLAEFGDRELLLHIKSNRAEEGELLANRLSTVARDRLRAITVYGGDNPIAALSARMPELRVTSKDVIKTCLTSYLAAGWTGYVPDSCAHRQLHIPEGYAPWLWGWPNKFLNRMDEADTRVILVAGSGDASQGFDKPDDLPRLPDGYTGGVWTNRIDLVAPLLRPAAAR